jgi:hypothetical protein
MKMKFKPILFLFILIASALAALPMQIRLAEAQNPHSNTATFYGTPDMIILNWTNFWQLFRQHAYWKLEGDRGLGWEDASQYLTVQRNYVNNGSTCKVTLIFDAPLTANYRLTFAIDKKAREYTHKEGTYNYVLVYEGYAVIFDWSDILSIPNLIVTHGMKDVSGEQWFWFRIQKDNVQKGVHVEIDPSITAYTTSSDGMLISSGATYADIWAQANADTYDNTTATLDIGQNEDFWIGRCFLFFNTSSIPDGATIQSATLGLYGKLDISVQDFNITIQTGQPTYPHGPLVVGDYNKTHYSGDGGKFDVSAFSLSGYNNITLNADGKSWISKTGMTKLCLRSDREIAGTQPDRAEDVQVYSYEKGEGYRPKLTVTYAFSLNLKVKDNNGNVIEGATVYANESMETSDLNGWANFTIEGDVVDVKVKFQDVWVNSTTVTMDSDKTIDVVCKVYSLTVYVQRSSASTSPNIPIVGATLTLTRTDGYNYTADGLSPATTVAYNSTHARYVWSQLANQTSSYTVTANYTGANQPESTTTSLTSNTEVEIELTISGLGPSGSTGGYPPSPPPEPPYIPPVELPKVPGPEFQYGIMVLVGVVGVAFVVGVARVDKRSSQTKIAQQWQRKTRYAENLEKKWKKKTRSKNRR